ncbi:helix-turn-helix transcriptional regulator [Roseibacillus ishigakijimensis]|uniref:Winged helix-turn-helix transcriptional regulator n=1 Tax=Roseibacillus ishigakijimensis TaxID=454146 RepID=A0A934RSK7_9BACT|nr:winged helix-turn-helix transcriptional regulator [Roseibacillus ishigakijimensis]MBK1834279.1 winged helix-turn-helix transcriptional regulator [Roseibacillus ishigakijimensis]
MFSQAVRDIARPTRVEILEALKKSEGLPISDLARQLGKSYMGVKQHCDELEGQGYLKCWRVPRSQVGVGRPEKLYRLTAAAEPLFPQAGVELTLEFMNAVGEQFGDNAPEKLLFRFFQKRAEEWHPRIAVGKSLVERCTRYVDLWESHGASARIHYQPGEGLRVEEFHNPLSALFAEYPRARAYEVRLMEELLATRVSAEKRQLGKAGERVIYLLTSL